jgi:ubiquinone/menaquinone biosynthesis C-methylase UbiE
VARLALNPTSHVLEVGAGSGFYSVEVARAVPNGYLELLDLQPNMLRKAQQKLVAKGMSNVGYTVADASQLSFEGESFNLVFLVTVLGEIVDQKAFLHEAYRVLKRGGILSISEHYPDPDFLPFSEVKRFVEKEGFQFLKRFGGNWNYTANFRKS